MPDEPVVFELPENLSELTLEALRALQPQAEAAFAARYDAGVSTPEDMAELQTLASAVQAVRAAVTTAEAAAPEPAPESAAEPPAAEPPAEPAPAAPPAPSPAEAMLEVFLRAMPPAGAAAPVAPAAAAEPPAASAEPAAPAAEPAALAADGSPAGGTELPVEEHQITILASADVAGFGAGTSIPGGLDGLVAACGAKARSLSDERGQGRPHQVASIIKPLREDRNLDGISEAEQRQRMGDLSSPAFLLASGGWCAPPETIYDFACEVEAPPEMVMLPTFTTVRGSVQYPVSPTFRDFMSLENTGLFTWTEADDIAAATGSPTKPCFKIPCVTFEKCTLELEGLCVTAGNLTDQAYPELVRRYLSLVLTGHLHRMNTQKILKMLALADDHVTIAASFAAASAMLSALELQVQDLRDQFSMSEGALIEAMMPRWIRGVIRADIARRECCDLSAVSNSAIASYLQASGIMLQFVSDWQVMGDPENPATTWPENVDVLLWLPGALKELTGPKLNIAVARDSVQNATNDFTLAFTEESYQVCKQGCGVRLVTIPVCPSGASGERVELDCPAA